MAVRFPRALKDVAKIRLEAARAKAGLEAEITRMRHSGHAGTLRRRHGKTALHPDRSSRAGAKTEIMRQDLDRRGRGCLSFHLDKDRFSVNPSLAGIGAMRSVPV